MFVNLFFLITALEFPWGDLPEGTTVCDFGGGVGNIATQLANSYPGLRIVLQDLAHQLKIAEEEVWPEHSPKAIAERRVEFIPFDFLKEPPKQGCDIFYVSRPNVLALNCLTHVIISAEKYLVCVFFTVNTLAARY